MTSSAVDARVVIAVDKLLNDGAILFCERIGDRFMVRITLNELYCGCGPTFVEAFNHAYGKVPRPAAMVAA